MVLLVLVERQFVAKMKELVSMSYILLEYSRTRGGYVSTSTSTCIIPAQDLVEDVQHRYVKMNYRVLRIEWSTCTR